MELNDAEALVVNLMEFHGLDEKGWRFEFDNAKSRLGLCNFDKKRITISRYMAAAATEEEIRQIALHEIAHALLRPGVGHGAEWKRTLRDIGGFGGRTARNPYVDPEIAARREARRTKRTEAVNAAAAAGITVDIGDVLLVRNKSLVTITRKARTRFYGVDQEGMEWFIPITHAPSLKLAAQNAA